MEAAKDYQIQRFGLKEVAYHNGQPQLMRRVGTVEWTSYVEPESALKPQDPSQTALRLFIVRKSQADGQHHWMIFITNEEDASNPGMVFQVTGDHTFMYYEHLTGVNQFETEDYADYRDLGPVTPEVMKIIRTAVDSVPPPQAPSQAEVKYNCQTWVIAVLQELVSMGLLDEKIISQLEAWRN